MQKIVGRVAGNHKGRWHSGPGNENRELLLSPGPRGEKVEISYRNLEADSDGEGYLTVADVLVKIHCKPVATPRKLSSPTLFSSLPPISCTCLQLATQMCSQRQGSPLIQYLTDAVPQSLHCTRWKRLMNGYVGQKEGHTSLRNSWLWDLRISFSSAPPLLFCPLALLLSPTVQSQTLPLI